MNVVYLSPHFPRNYQQFCLALTELGVNVLGLGNEPHHLLEPRLKDALAEYYYVEDLENYDHLLRGCGYFTHRYGKIHRIESHAEYWLETEARLRTDFNVPGIQNDTIQTIKRKSLMKEVYREAGIPVARGQVCHTQAEVLKLANDVGFPLVAKPDIGVGALATYKLTGKADVERFFTNKPPVHYIFEEFIAGDLYSFDGLVDARGELLFYTSHHYSQGVMETVQDDNHIYYYSLREIPPDLEAAGRKVLKAFDVKERFFHFEFFRSYQTGQWVALEVNMRPPGGLTTDMFNFANNFDIYREWANVVVNGRFEAQWSRPYHVIYIGRKNHLPYAHTHEEILRRYDGLICHHEPISSVFSSALGNYGYLARSPNLEELLQAAHTIQQVNDHAISAA